MTITLPYDPPLADAFDPVPGNNNGPTPVGAPEGHAPSLVNDISRHDKAASNQNWQNIEAINNALGTMAEQDATAVNITGGTIGSSVTVAQAQDSLQLAGQTLTQLYQTIYDTMYPVGEAVVHRHIESPPPVFPGVSATWTLIASGRYFKSISPGQTVGDTFGGQTTDPAGGHDHSGTTGATALTIAQMPTHNHAVTAVGPGGSGTAPGTGIDNDTSALITEDTGSGQPHNHSITAVGDHTHTYDPATYRIATYLRTA